MVGDTAPVVIPDTLAAMWRIGILGGLAGGLTAIAGLAVTAVFLHRGSDPTSDEGTVPNVGETWGDAQHLGPGNGVPDLEHIARTRAARHHHPTNGDR